MSKENMSPTKPVQTVTPPSENENPDMKVLHVQFVYPPEFQPVGPRNSLSNNIDGFELEVVPDGVMVKVSGKYFDFVPMTNVKKIRYGL